MIQGEIVIPKVWRSELLRLALFAVLSAAAVVLSRNIPASIITGTLFTVGGKRIQLSLPLFWLAPAWALASAMIRIYNVRYVIDEKGLESRVGIISFSQVVTRIRFEDIRSIETEQTIIERVLDIGIVEMGTSATAGLEMIFDGIAHPLEVQRIIQEERDERIKAERGPSDKGADTEAALEETVNA